MKLSQALPQWVTSLPLVVVEDLLDATLCSARAVANDGTVSVDRIPNLRKVYLIEPCVKQIVRVSILQKIVWLPTVLSTELFHLFAGARFVGLECRDSFRRANYLSYRLWMTLLRPSFYRVCGVADWCTGHQL
jgi:hypothetical protein